MRERLYLLFIYLSDNMLADNLVQGKMKYVSVKILPKLIRNNLKKGMII